MDQHTFFSPTFNPRPLLFSSSPNFSLICPCPLTNFGWKFYYNNEGKSKTRNPQLSHNWNGRNDRYHQSWNLKGILKDLERYGKNGPLDHGDTRKDLMHEFHYWLTLAMLETRLHWHFGWILIVVIKFESEEKIHNNNNNNNNKNYIQHIAMKYYY